MSFFAELRRRNVLRIGAAYLVSAWLIVQVADTVFPLFGFGDGPARLLVVVLAVGLLPALVVAWVFELTPEGLKRESEIDHAGPVHAGAARRLDRIIILVLAMAVAYFALDKFLLSPQWRAPETGAPASTGSSAPGRTGAGASAVIGADASGEKAGGRPSIAVLPFVNVSPDPEQEFFSDGITDELLNMLVSIPELRVISRSSSFAFKGSRTPLPEIAAALNVDHVLEGSVRRAGDRVRITAQLIEARTDRQLWSRTYDRTLDDIFAVQDEIAGAVMMQLRLTLFGDAPRARETSPEAYALFLQARYLGRQLNAVSLERSNALYEEVLSADPNYAPAWGGLSVNYINLTNNGLLPIAEGAALAREAAQTAISIDPDDALAYSRLGYIAMSFDQDLAGAARYFQRAFALAPANIDIISNASGLLMALGRVEEAIAVYEYTVTRDPLDPLEYFNLGIGYLYAHRWEEALVTLRQLLRLNPEFLVAHFGSGIALLYLGDTAAALAEMNQEPLDAYRLTGVAIVEHARGDAAASDAALEELITEHGEEWSYRVACVLAARGETDAAFEWLDQAMARGGSAVGALAVDPLLVPLHDDPRWGPLLASVGRSPAQLAAIEFAVELPASRPSR